MAGARDSIFMHGQRAHDLGFAKARVRLLIGICNFAHELIAILIANVLMCLMQNMETFKKSAPDFLRR
jgi:hypothetical protein